MIVLMNSGDPFEINCHSRWLKYVFAQSTLQFSAQIMLKIIYGA